MSTEQEQVLEDAARRAPLVLTSLQDQESLQFIRNLLPYDTGFEIECDLKKGARIKAFKAIPNIKDVDVYTGYCQEQRFRIPPGVNGLVCLFNISQVLKTEAELNPLSGIHYHVDLTKKENLWWKKLQEPESIQNNSEWILNELDTWGYKGKYNGRSIGTGHQWIRFNSLGTAEFRCGEMTFEYKELVKCILSAHSIITRWKKAIDPSYVLPTETKIPTGPEASVNHVLEEKKKLNARIEALRAKCGPKKEEDPDEIIKRRIQ